MKILQGYPILISFFLMNGDALFSHTLNITPSKEVLWYFALFCASHMAALS